jgi:hypothetical protein
MVVKVVDYIGKIFGYTYNKYIFFESQPLSPLRSTAGYSSQLHLVLRLLLMEVMPMNASKLCQ